MSTYKVTIGIKTTYFSATETYWSKDTDAAGIGPLVTALLAARSGMLMNSWTFRGVRIGDAILKRRSKLYTPGTYTTAASGIDMFVPQTGALVGGSTNGYADQARAALMADLRFGTDRHSRRYFAGVPDAVLGNEENGVQTGGFPNFLTAFIAFRDRLVADGWRIRCQDKTGIGLPKPIKTWGKLTTDPSNVYVAVLDANVITLDEKRFIYIENTRRRGTDRTSYNGRYYVEDVIANPADGTTRYVLRGTETGDPASVKLPGTIRSLVYTFLNITGLVTEQSVTHKRGNSFAQPRGSRRRRLSLDP